MKVTISLCLCIVVDDTDESKQPEPSLSPLDDLIERMRREVQHGRDSVDWKSEEKRSAAIDRRGG